MARIKIKTLNDGGPVGSVIQSMLSLAQFQEENGDGWALADGSDVTGSRYASITGNTNIPDLRGRFLRAKDNGAGVDPDGEKVVGAAFNHKTANPGLATTSDGSHDHNLVHNSDGGGGTSSWPGGDHMTQRGSAGDSYYRLQGTNSNPNVALSSSNGSHTHPIVGGDNETTPKHVVVNFFIKIN